MIRFVVKHSPLVMLLIGVIVSFGMVSYIGLPREASPDVKIPVVMVTTPYIGVSPEDVESLVTIPIENELAGVKDLKKLSSTSAEGVSVVSLEFEPDVVISDALQRVRDRVDRAKPKLPEDVEEPEVREISFSDFPILIVNLAGGVDEEQLKALAEELEEEAGRIPGVLETRISGGLTREVRVQVDPRRLATYGLSLDDVLGAIGNENVNIPGGDVTAGSTSFLLRVPGDFDQASDIEKVAIKRVGDRPVFIRDVGRVIDGYAERASYARMSGESSVSLSVTKRAGASIIDIADEVKVIAETQSGAWPAGVEYRVLADQSKMIRQMVSELENNIITALLLVVAVLIFFMGPRASLFVAISIPLSMLMAFILIEAFGMTLNMIVLFSLILALGMLVDNAIVIVENVYRHVEEGEDVITASIEGTREVALAVAASTATTVAAFFPLVFWTGIMGEFMGFLPKTVIIVLISSLVVAVGILPVLTSKLLKAKAAGTVVAPADRSDSTVMALYRRVLNASIEHRYISAGLGVGSLVATFVAYGVLNHGTEFFPDTEPDRATISVRAPDGTDLEETDRIVRRIEGVLQALENIDVYNVETGVGGGGSPMEGAQAQGNAARITVDFLPHPNDAGPDETARVESTERTIEKIRGAVIEIPGAEIEVEKERMGPPVGAPIAVEVSGDDFHGVGELAATVRRRIATVPGVTDLSDDYRVGRPEMRLRIDRGAAKRVGASTAQVANTVRTAVAGTKASALRDGTDEYDIIVELDPRYRDNLQDVLGLRVPGRLDTSPETFQVPLTAVASYELVGGSGAIRHVDQDLVVTIGGDVAEGYNENEVREGVVALIAEMKSAGEIPPSYDLRLGGANDEQRDAQAFLGRAFLLACALIMVVLVTQFNSFRTPLIILFTVLLSLVGVLWGLILTGTAFGVIMTGLGVISLAGVVVNNAIVLLDYVEQLRQQGMERRDALIQAGMTRFRPVMLTAVTTVLGLVPMALGISIDFRSFRLLIGGGSSQFWGPMAVAVIFGLAFATVLTLVMVPTLYSISDDVGAFTKRVFGGRAATAAAAAAVVLMVLAPASAQAAPITLEDAWRAAGVNNIDLQIAREGTVQAEAQRGQAWALLLPKVSAQGSYTINQYEIAFDPASDFGDFGDVATDSAEGQAALLDGLADSFEALHPGEPVAQAIAQGYRDGAQEIRDGLASDDTTAASDPVVIQQKTAWAGSVSVVQPLFTGSALPLLRGSYAQAEGAEATVRRTEQQVRAGVTRAYYGLLTARRRVTLAEQGLQSAQSHLQLAERQVTAGLQPPRARIQAQLSVSQAQRDLASAHEARTAAELGFAQVTGLESTVELAVPAPPAVPATVDQALGETGDSRPDVTAAQKRAEVARYYLRSKNAEWLPTFDARFTWSYTQNTGFQDDPTLWMVVFGANWQIWSGGVRIAQARELKSQVRQADLSVEKLRQDVDIEIRNAWRRLERAQQALSATEVEVSLAEQNLALAEASMTAGSATWLEVEDARLGLIGSQLSQLAERMNRDLAAVELRVAMGAY
jgi:multidrug efflux pump subunit AcrB/outer membrane protein TolC